MSIIYAIHKKTSKNSAETYCQMAGLFSRQDFHVKIVSAGRRAWCIEEAAGISGIVPMPAASVVRSVRRCYFTRPFSRYSARLVRMTAATWSAATFCMSCCTMSGTVATDGWRRVVRHIDLGDHNIAFDLRGAALTTTTRRISRMLRLTGLLG